VVKIMEVGACRRVLGGRQWWPAAGLGGDGRTFVFFSLGSNSGRPFLNRWLRLEDTPSRGNLSKETLGFLEINPRSLAHSRKYVFMF
jgi:hypothetical protein